MNNIKINKNNKLMKFHIEIFKMCINNVSKEIRNYLNDNNEML